MNPVGRHARGSKWQFELLGSLASPSAPRVLTPAALTELIERFRPRAAKSTRYDALERLIAAGFLRRITSGVFLNTRALPATDLYEAAAYIRRGAVVSLHSVLGEAGVLNNPSAIVTAVLPSSAHSRPRLGDVTTSAGARFRFCGLTERFFPGDEADRALLLQPGRPSAMFRPEAALLQWLYLSGNRRSTLTGLPGDIDLELLDRELLDHLAERWKLVTALEQLRERQARANASP